MMLRSMSSQYVAIAVVINVVVSFFFVVSHPAATAEAEWERPATRYDHDCDRDKKRPEQQQPTTTTIN